MEMFTLIVNLLATVKVAKDGRFYVVNNGHAHFLKEGVIKLINTNNKEDKMKVKTFLKVHPILGEVRIVTNNPTPAEARRYNESVKTGMPVDGLFAINQGDWLPWLLIEQLDKKGVQFRLLVAKNGCINPFWSAPKEEWRKFRNTWEELVGKVDFACANASTTFLIQFGNERKWGLDALQTVLLDVPKTGKRANELVRTTMFWFRTENKDEIEALRVKIGQPRGISPAARDGMTYVSKSFALKLTECILNEDNRIRQRADILSGRITRLNGRIMIPAGVVTMFPDGALIKGDIIIRPDRKMAGYDIITPPENLKAELRPMEYISFSASEHHPVHEATWDIQRIMMNPQILTHDHRMRDLQRLLAEVKSVINSGELPAWMLLPGNEAHDEQNGGIPKRDDYKDQDEAIMRWQAAGLDIRAAGNMLRMAMGSVINRMAREFDGGYVKGVASGYAKSMWLPKSNAMVALIVSHGSLTKIGNYKSKYDGSKSWFHPKIGLVIADHRFEKIQSLTGGSDFDDSVELDLVKIWSSDPAVTKMMADNGVIEDENIPTNPNDASFQAAVLRSPNGVGEFSFIEIEDIMDLPWQFMDVDTVQIIDLATLPLPQAEAMKKVQVQPLVSSIQHTKQPWSRDNALRQILAQQFNQGIGAVANSIMAWAGVAGPSMPPSMTAPFEQLVDGAQQLSDPAIFAAIEAEAAGASAAALRHLKTNDGTVDKYLIPRFYKVNTSEVKEFAVDGPLSEFQEAYRAAIKEIYSTVEMKTLQMRAAQPIIQWVRQLQFGTVAYNWAKEFNTRYSAKLSKVDAQFSEAIDQSAGMAKITLQRTKHARIRQVINEAVAEINTFDLPGQRVLALWHYMVSPDKPNAHGKRNMPLGVGDRLMFQQGDGVSLMDILIPVLHERGWGNPVTEPDVPFLPITEDEDEDMTPEELAEILAMIMDDED